MKRRQALARLGSGGALLLLIGPHQIARGATIVAVRIWPAKDYTRVTIESDGVLQARQFFVSDPPRLAVDIEGIDLVPGLRELVSKVKSDDPNISGIRVGQNAPNVVRLVVDLKQPITPQVFSLLPVATYKHRLVLDLHPSSPPDPLQDLINQRLQELQTRSTAETVPVAPVPAPAAPATPASDPLGDLIAQRSQKAPGQQTPAIVATPTPSPQPETKPPQAQIPTDKLRAPARTELKSSPKTDRLIVIALDPGHGGEDPGAIGPNGTQEKDVVLAIARRLRDRIDGFQINGSPMRAFMTRDADFFVPLHVRVDKARRVQADLFVSLHADAFFSPRPQGASIYALSDRGASSAAARWMASKENAADLVGGLNTEIKDASLHRALLDMSTTAQINDSLKLGHAMLREIGRVGKLHKPQVEQASFAVLKAPDIPSVLVETAFISNPDEEKRLTSVAYQEQLAEALLKGIARYFSRNPPLARSRSL